MYMEDELLKNRSLASRIGIQFFADGEGSSGEGSEGNDGGDNNPPDGSAGGKTFSQADVNALLANEKRSARAAILKELGYEVKDGKVKETIDKVKGVLDSSKTQQQLDQEAKNKAETDLADERTKSAKLQAQLDVVKAGVKTEYVDDVIAMLLPRVTEEKTLTALIEDHKEKYPNWFGDNSTSKGTGGPTNPGSRGKTGTTGDMGKRLAQINKPTGKSSYFKN